MPVALGVLPMGEEALRDDKMQMILGAGHRDIEQTALLLDFGGGAGAEIGGNAAVDGVQHEDRFPLLPLRRMDCGQDQIILVEQRHARLIAGRVRRIEGQFRQETFAGRITGGDLLQLQEIGQPDGGILMNAVEVRLVPASRQLDLGRPGGMACADGLERGDEGSPVVA